jgi:hypothetical protein
MAPYEVEDDSYEGLTYSPSCACDAESVQVQAVVPVAEAWAAHRIYQESKWADLAAECERKRYEQRGSYLRREDGLTYTEADRRKRWAVIQDRKAKEAEYEKLHGTSLFGAILKDKFVGPIRDTLTSSNPFWQSSFSVPLKANPNTVTPGTFAESLGLEVIRSPLVPEDTIVVTGSALESYRDATRDVYRIPVPEVAQMLTGQQNPVLRWMDELGTDEIEVAGKDGYEHITRQQVQPQIITSPRIQQQYADLMKRHGVTL